ncbi:MAG: AAA family ATPase [Spirochaetes bacterium]|nr:AAA family ATPase [Spirochaetota bacterium]
MQFRRFRIKNYRSLIDSGWNDLASDNITGIIGQNESGKTSILEALYSFYTGKINEDILRSDLSLPAVYCAFETNTERISRLLKGKIIPIRVIESIEETGLVILGREWDNEKNSHLIFGDDKLTAHFQEQINEKQEFERKTEEDILRIIEGANKAGEELQYALNEKINEERHLSALEVKKVKIQKSFDRSPDKENNKRLEKFIAELDQSKKRLEEKTRSYDSQLDQATGLAEKAKYANWCLDSVIDYKNKKKIFEDSLAELKMVKTQYENITGILKKRRFRSRLNILEGRYADKLENLEKARIQESDRKAIVAKIFNGMDPGEAEELVKKENKRKVAYYNDRELAEEIFKNIPVFEMFEDFSSLLPNRIDIDDIFASSSHVEGYKAAQNFLTIANLDESFFEVSDNRILKQKIEKLNSEITLNFQDYWQQNLDNKNKIQINFELEHYDNRHPDKMGKPYLEFWIKDNLERLYPKQRSRGVRWFISFYLELKASAIKHKGKSRVFLIDEPGLSLHARAQEDVLNVFEDIKEDIQIIYTTHSPHLINISKLYRLLAVQRFLKDDMKSGTVIFNARSLNEASIDTLSPIYTLMGTKFNDNQLIHKKNNLILEDTVTYYYLKTIFDLIDFKKEIFFLPATDVYNVPALVNLLIGWKLDFVVLLDDDDCGNQIFNDIKLHIFHNNENLAAKKILKITDKSGIEDLFSTIDFKNFILHKRVGITESNVEYIENKNLSRNILASNFVLHVQNNNVKLEDFDEETRENIRILIYNLESLLE